MRSRLLLGLFAPLSFGSIASGQWDTTSFSGAPVYEEGALVLHDNGVFVAAFSASVPTWRPIGPTSADVLGTGDWCALVELPDGSFRGYSARHHDTADLHLSTPPTEVRIEDDLALVINFEAGIRTAHAYSAHRNHWRSIEIPGLVSRATSRFVVGIQDGTRLLGFSSRTGEWEAFVAPFCNGMRANGNVVMTEQHLPDEVFMISITFSGMLGRWSISPPLWPGYPTAIDHNVAYARYINPPVSAGYSAASGCWAIVEPLGVPEYGAVILRDDLVLAERLDGGTVWEAFGAMPGRAWATSQGDQLLEVGESCAVVHELADRRFEGFSGVFAGAWVPLHHSGGPSATRSGEHVALVRTTGGQNFGFSAARSEWSAPRSVSGSELERFAEGAYAFIRTDLERVAFSSRTAEWASFPLGGGGSSPMIGGGFAGEMECPGDLTMTMYNSRRNEFSSFPSGFTACAEALAERNVALAYSDVDQQLMGYSTQRGIFHPFAVDLPSSLISSSELDENVAWVQFGSARQRRLAAYGAMGEASSWYQYPDGSEFTRRSSDESDLCIPPTDQYLGMTFRGEPGRPLILVVGARLDLPLTVGSYGNQLWIDPGTWLFLPLGSLDANGLRHIRLRMPNGPALGFEAWFQAIRGSSSGLEFTADHPGAAWIL